MAWLHHWLNGWEGASTQSVTAGYAPATDSSSGPTLTENVTAGYPGSSSTQYGPTLTENVSVGFQVATDKYYPQFVTPNIMAGHQPVTDNQFGSTVFTVALPQSLRATFPTPTRPLRTDMLQEFRILVRKWSPAVGGGGSPDVYLDLYDNAVLVSTVATQLALTNTGGLVLIGTWDASTIGSLVGTTVEARVRGPGVVNGNFELGAIRWFARIQSPVQTISPALMPKTSVPYGPVITEQIQAGYRAAAERSFGPSVENQIQAGYRAAAERSFGPSVAEVLVPTEMHVSFFSPSRNLKSGSTQIFKVLARKRGTGTHPLMDIEVRDTGGVVIGSVSSVQVTTSTYSSYEVQVASSSFLGISGTDVELRASSPGAIGGIVEFGAARWYAPLRTSTPGVDVGFMPFTGAYYGPNLRENLSPGYPGDTSVPYGPQVNELVIAGFTPRDSQVYGVATELQIRPAFKVSDDKIFGPLLTERLSPGYPGQDSKEYGPQVTQNLTMGFVPQSSQVYGAAVQLQIRPEFRDQTSSYYGPILLENVEVGFTPPIDEFHGPLLTQNITVGFTPSSDVVYGVRVKETIDAGYTPSQDQSYSPSITPTLSIGFTPPINQYYPVTVAAEEWEITVGAPPPVPVSIGPIITEHLSPGYAGDSSRSYGPNVATGGFTILPGYVPATDVSYGAHVEPAPFQMLPGFSGDTVSRGFGPRIRLNIVVGSPPAPPELYWGPTMGLSFQTIRPARFTSRDRPFGPSLTRKDLKHREMVGGFGI